MEKSGNSNDKNNIKKQTSEDQTNLIYKGDRISTNVPLSFIKENLNLIFSNENLDKCLNGEDIATIAKFLPPNISHSNKPEELKTKVKEILNTYNFSKFSLKPLDIFEKMLEKKYFTENYQNYLKKFTEVDALEDYLSIMQSRHNKLKQNFEKYNSIFSRRKREYGEVIDEEGSMDMREEYRIDDANLNANFFDMHSEFASSGYTTINSDEEKEEFNEAQDNQMSNTHSELGNEKVIDNEPAYEGTLSDERFKNLKMNKNQLTIRPRNKTEIQDFQSQEMERYKNPHLPWTYYNSDGSTSVVAPVLKKMPSSTSSKPRDHIMLKSDRPSFVTILCLARDAASRLPEGVGTRADICDLLKDSQFINERLSDSQINNIVSGALDRLHYEKDPCVKYDLQKKLWIYLHKNRTVDFPPWNEHLKKDTAGNVSQADIEIPLDEKAVDLDNSSVSNVNTGNINPTITQSSKKRSHKKADKDKLLSKKRKGVEIIHGNNDEL